MSEAGSSDRRTAERWSLAVLLLLAAVAGIAARAIGLFHDPFWLDEAYSAFAAGHDLAFLWQVVPRYETHPPFYYTLLHIWELPFGDSLAALRALGLVAGLLTPPVLAWSAGRFGHLLALADRRRRRLVAVAFALACLSTPFVEMTREVRPYALMILVYAAAVGTLASIAIRRRDGLPLGGAAYVAYLGALALMLWLHNLGPLWAMAMGIALLAAIGGRPMRATGWSWLIGGHGLVALVYLPAASMLRDQAPTWVHSTWLLFKTDGLWDRLSTLYAVPGWQGIAALALAMLAAAALRRRPEGRRTLAMLLALAIVPTLLSIGLSLTIAPVFLTRTLTPVAGPALLLLALGAVLWDGRGAWLGGIAAAMLAANLLAVDAQVRRNGPMQDWYGTVGWLAQRIRPGDRIFAYPNEGALPIERAMRDRGLGWPIRAIPGPMPADDPSGWHPTGSRGVVSLPPWRLRQIATAPATQAVPTIWLLRLGPETYDPGDVFLHELARDRRVVRHWRDGPIDIVGLARR